MSVRMEKISDKETEIIINESIKVTISEDSFNATGEMSVEYDETKLTEAEASAIVNEYFSKVLNVIANNEKADKIESLKERIGEIE